MTDASPRERMIIDTHVHLLDPAQFPYPEPTTGYRPSQDENASLDDLRGVMEAHGVSAAVLVAASVYGADNASLIAALAAEPDRLRVIVGCDPEDPGALNALARIPGVAGVRLNLTDDGAFAGGTERLRRLVARIGGLGLIACIQASPAAALAVIGGDGQTPVVLDHLGRPDLAGGLPALRRLAERSNTWLKLSGPFRIGAAVSGLSDWRRPAPLARAAVDQFQSNRLIWGSDWPFINLAGPRPGYRECLDWARDLVDAPFAANARGLFWERRHG